MTDQTSQIRALAGASDGNFPQLVETALANGSSADTFFADLTTLTNRQPVSIASGQTLTAGEVLFQTVSTGVVAAGGNVGGGTLTVAGAGPGVLPGVYSATCTSTRTARGIFDVKDPRGNVIGKANVGTAFVSDHLSFTIADGSPDFAIGDNFNVTVTMGATYSAANFADDAPLQIATGVLSVDVDTTAGIAEQFATASGPAILPTATLHVPAWDRMVEPEAWWAARYTAAAARATEQLSRRGIVLRNAVAFAPNPA